MNSTKIFDSLFNPAAFYQMYFTGFITLIVSIFWFDLAKHFSPESPPNIYEFFGTWLNLWCVWLTVRQNPWCWPTGILGVIFFGVALYYYGLYSSVVLNLVYYFPVQFYGWWEWEFGGYDIVSDRRRRKVSVLRNGDRLCTFLLVAICVFFWGEFVSTYPDAKMIFLDASIAGMSVVAQLIMSYKKIESWVLWVVVDILSIYMFWEVQAYMAAMLYAVFLCLASKGLYDWFKEYNSNWASYKSLVKTYKKDYDNYAN